MHVRHRNTDHNHGTYLFPNNDETPKDPFRLPANNPNTLKRSQHHFMHNKLKNNMYNVWQCRIYNFLERPRGYLSGFYHVIM